MWLIELKDWTWRAEAGVLALAICQSQQVKAVAAAHYQNQQVEALTAGFWPWLWLEVLAVAFCARPSRWRMWLQVTAHGPASVQWQRAARAGILWKRWLERRASGQTLEAEESRICFVNFWDKQVDYLHSHNEPRSSHNPKQNML